MTLTDCRYWDFGKRERERININDTKSCKIKLDIVSRISGFGNNFLCPEKSAPLPVAGSEQEKRRGKHGHEHKKGRTSEKRERRKKERQERKERKRKDGRKERKKKKRRNAEQDDGGESSNVSRIKPKTQRHVAEHQPEYYSEADDPRYRPTGGRYGSSTHLDRNPVMVLTVGLTIVGFIFAALFIERIWIFTTCEKVVQSISNDNSLEDNSADVISPFKSTTISPFESTTISPVTTAWIPYPTTSEAFTKDHIMNTKIKIYQINRELVAVDLDEEKNKQRSLIIQNQILHAFEIFGMPLKNLIVTNFEASVETEGPYWMMDAALYLDMDKNMPRLMWYGIPFKNYRVVYQRHALYLQILLWKLGIKADVLSLQSMIITLHSSESGIWGFLLYHTVQIISAQLWFNAMANIAYNKLVDKAERVAPDSELIPQEWQIEVNSYDIPEYEYEINYNE